MSTSALRSATTCPAFTGTGKERVTVEMLLTHTSGLPVGAKVTGLPDNAARWNAVLTTPLVSGAVPGNTFRYSSVGLMVAGKIVEKVTGQRLDQALKSNLTDPLGLRDTGFNPNTWLSAAAKASRLVATDARSSRGLLRGIVHDDVANHLGGIAGHAGIFATATDLAAIGQLLLDGGTHQGKRILAAATVRRMLTDHNAGKPAIDPERPNRTSAHGLGVVLNQSWFMGKLASARTFGHTGFAGPSLLVDARPQTRPGAAHQPRASQLELVEPRPGPRRRRRPARHKRSTDRKVWTIAPHPDTILALVVQILRPPRWRIDAHVSPETALRAGRRSPSRPACPPPPFHTPPKPPPHRRTVR